MKNKISALTLCIFLVQSIFSTTSFAAETWNGSDAIDDIISSQAIEEVNSEAMYMSDKIDAFIADSRWKNGASYGTSPARKPYLQKAGGYTCGGCRAYAYDFIAYVYGRYGNPATTGTSYGNNSSEIRRGDVIFTPACTINGYSYSDHWFVILGRNGNTLTTAEAAGNKVCIASNHYSISGNQIYFGYVKSGIPKPNRNFTGYHYGDIGQVAPPATNVTVATTSAQNVTETNAVVYGTVSYSGTKPSEVGVYFGTSPDNMTIIGRDAINHNKNPFDMWYDLNKNGVTLSKATTYYWQCYAIAGGTAYYGEKKSFTTPGDITPPTISDISVTDIDESGYTINCTITDDTTIGLVQFPTWTAYNDQDDLNWHTYSENVATNSVNINYRINCADHNNETGTYITHIYAWDWSSNQATYGGELTIVNIEPKLQEYTVTYNANGGTGEPGNQIKIQGEDLILDNTTPTRAGYTFVGWGLSPDSINAEYQPGGIYSIDADVTLYAIWKENEIIQGDIDGNGRVDSIDSLRFLKYIAGLDVTIDEEVADINGDGIIDSLDSLKLLKVVAGLDSDV